MDIAHLWHSLGWPLVRLLASLAVGLLVANCIISNNSGSIKHGAVFNDWGNFTARDCTFANNTAINKGGAIINYGHDLTLLRCLFAGNSANNGGAVSFPNTSGSA